MITLPNACTVPVAAERLVGFLDAQCGLREQSTALWQDIRTLTTHPLAKQAMASPGFQSVVARRHELTTFDAVTAAVNTERPNFGLTMPQIFMLGGMIMKHNARLPLVRSFITEYAAAVGLPEGTAALEIGLYLSAPEQADESTRTLLGEIERRFMGPL